MICLLSWATVLGFLRFVTGRQHVTWEKVDQGNTEARFRESLRPI
jgi:hypothetical protein